MGDMDQRHPWVGIEEGTIEVRELRPPVDVEPPRQGEDPAECRACGKEPDEWEVYRDALWRVRVLTETAFPGTAMMQPLRHADGVHGLNDAELATYGPMVARITAALEGMVGFRGARTARVHSHLWNDGGAHLHQWFFPRPYGYADLLGSTLVEWLEVLPQATEEQSRAAATELRARLAR
jgi:diadenosine tetraphosphate (Ap4A) HIT family hydrolase